MRATWLAAFALASMIAAVVTPMLRRVAVEVGFVDAPAPHKSHLRPMPYLGGVAIAGAALGGWLLESGLTKRIGAVAIAAIAIGLMGLVDDHRKLDPWPRLAVESAAAVAVVAVGVRAEVTSIAAINIAITIFWIVGVTNALNLLDNMDGLSAGIAAVVAAGTFALAAIEGQSALATVVIALCGACTGFLVYNWRPASIFMGDAGSLFIGFVLSVAVLEAKSALLYPENLAVPLLLVALPLLDTSVVSIARFRRGRSVMSGGRDHLSHRLVSLGVAPGVAVAVLVGAQGVLALLAVLSGSGVLPVWSTAATTVVVLGTLAAVTARANVYGEIPVLLPVRSGRELASAPRPDNRDLISW